MRARIEAGGAAVLAAGGEVYLQDDSGLGLVQVRKGQDIGVDFSTATAIQNSGTITATKAQLEAANGNMYELAINTTSSSVVNALNVTQGQDGRVMLMSDGGTIKVSGTVKARSQNGSGQNRGGHVTINAGVNGPDTGTTYIHGTVDVAGDGNTGGTAEILGDRVAIMDGARITADGTGTLKATSDEATSSNRGAGQAGQGGGTILIGGDYLGTGDTPRADMVTIQEDAVITANAEGTGDGGKVIAWSDDITRFYGSIEAQGGQNGGDGGFVETSGKDTLQAYGSVSAAALSADPNDINSTWQGGMWLLDPTDITISNNVDATVTAATPFTPNADNGASNLNITTLQNALATGNVTVQTSATGAQSGYYRQ
jgi:hypothetical protein